ncbi:MAG: hypothetical protein LPK26_04815 [Bacillaceae bacterium]|nr:hypothetical protein [Bacillaceae bacterium]
MEKTLELKMKKKLAKGKRRSKIDNVNNVYIPSLEACDIYSHLHREHKFNIDMDYLGMVPYSLELAKLRKEGLSTQKLKINKEVSRDIINVKFDISVKDSSQLLDDIESKILSQKDKIANLEKEAEANRGEIEKINKYIEELNKEGAKLSTNYQRVSLNDLRYMLYKDGITINWTDSKNNLVDSIEYCIYKRSSAKSRVGEILMINKKLYDVMCKWSKMEIEFPVDKNIDLASLSAYESLVSSTIKGKVKIDPKNILLIDDRFSEFTYPANVIYVNGKGELGVRVDEKAKFNNNLFDGQSILDSRYFEITKDIEANSFKNKGCILLRNHFFKSLAINCNLQEWLRDYAEEKNIDFDTWELEGLNKQRIRASKVHMITTPSSLKALKFSDYVDGEMFEYWKKVVKDDGCQFGIVKSESSSKLGVKIQQMSYQMVNSLDLSKDEVKKLAQKELTYIDELKNNINVFMEHLDKTKNDMNTHQMWIDIYKINKNIVKTETFRKLRAREINGYVDKVKSGKLRIDGAEYCTMVGNPMLMLNIAAGNIEYVDQLQGNEMYTTLFETDKEYVGFRNPHTAQSNVFLGYNKKVKDIDTYFNLTDNMIVMNAVKYPTLDILSGSDYDSDSICLFDNEIILNASRKMQGKYIVCQNDIESDKTEYKLSNHSFAELDSTLSKSKINIGTIVNCGQNALSKYWKAIHNNKDKVAARELMEIISKMTILSGISIDSAKKLYAIDLDGEIKKALKHPLLKGEKKPNFFEYVSEDNKIKEKIEHHECPMDYLIQVIHENVENAESNGNVELADLFKSKEELGIGKKENNKQILEIEEKFCEYVNKIASIHAMYRDSEREKKAKNTHQDNVHQYTKLSFFKKKVEPQTMYNLMQRVVKGRYKESARFMNMLYLTHQGTFLDMFKSC